LKAQKRLPKILYDCVTEFSLERAIKYLVIDESVKGHCIPFECTMLDENIVRALVNAVDIFVSASRFASDLITASRRSGNELIRCLSPCSVILKTCESRNARTVAVRGTPPKKTDLPNGLPRADFGKGVWSVVSLYGKPSRGHKIQCLWWLPVSNQNLTATDFLLLNVCGDRLQFA
jgi:hypothetical protein